MNTCQTSIKTDIFIIVLLKPPSWSIRQSRDHQNGSLRTDQSREGQRTNNDLPNTYSKSTTETIMHPIGQNIPLIYPHFEAAIIV